MDRKPSTCPICRDGCRFTRDRAPGSRQNYVIGEKAGVESVTLTLQQIPVHNHAMMASAAIRATATADERVPGTDQSRFPLRRIVAAAHALNAGSLGPVGGSQPHDNMAPYLAINYIISLFGVFPSQG